MTFTAAPRDVRASMVKIIKTSRQQAVTVIVLSDRLVSIKSAGRSGSGEASVLKGPTL